jgi:biopolymer transport protein ExbD
VITRPLQLSLRLAGPARDWDWLFFVNAGLIALFFTVFGSRFVLAPALGTDFEIPALAPGQAGAYATTHVISVKRGALVFTDSGQLTLAQLREWLAAASRTVRQPVLLLRASADVSMADLAEITTAAREAGFRVVLGVETRVGGNPSPAP